MQEKEIKKTDRIPDKGLMQMMPETDKGINLSFDNEIGFPTLIILEWAHIIVGIIAIIGGIILCVDTYRGGEAYIIGGLISGLICFTLAVIVKACRIFIEKNT